MEESLAGKSIVVTGAKGRLGQRMVQGLETRGGRVAKVDQDGNDVIAADLSDEASVLGAFSEIRRQFGSIDALVHTVGMWAEWPLLDTTLERWNLVMRINLTTSLLCMREAARLMLPAGGTIVGISAKPGLEGATAQGAAYAASKAGLVRLLEAVTEEHPQIATHAIAPSFILFGGEPAGSQGVKADDLVSLACLLCTPAGPAISGTALRAYGTLR